MSQEQEDWQAQVDHDGNVAYGGLLLFYVTLRRYLICCTLTHSHDMQTVQNACIQAVAAL